MSLFCDLLAVSRSDAGQLRFMAWYHDNESGGQLHLATHLGDVNTGSDDIESFSPRAWAVAVAGERVISVEPDWDSGGSAPPAVALRTWDAPEPSSWWRVPVPETDVAFAVAARDVEGVASVWVFFQRRVEVPPDPDLYRSYWVRLTAGEAGLELAEGPTEIHFGFPTSAPTTQGYSFSMIDGDPLRGRIAVLADGETFAAIGVDPDEWEESPTGDVVFTFTLDDNGTRGSAAGATPTAQDMLFALPASQYLLFTSQTGSIVDDLAFLP